jgi:hypothetical protein
MIILAAPLSESMEGPGHAPKAPSHLTPDRNVITCVGPGDPTRIRLNE